ncbi:MAG: hypothetical protein EBX51_01465, partial [Acidimicrobiia bacterium]|nr:hypothetical protein [Acidimicrobiia bacterium]
MQGARHQRLRHPPQHASEAREEVHGDGGLHRRVLVFQRRQRQMQVVQVLVQSPWGHAHGAALQVKLLAHELCLGGKHALLRRLRDAHLLHELDQDIHSVLQLLSPSDAQEVVAQRLPARARGRRRPACIGHQRNGGADHLCHTGAAALPHAERCQAEYAQPAAAGPRGVMHCEARQGPSPLGQVQTVEVVLCVAARDEVRQGSPCHHAQQLRRLAPTGQDAARL